MALEGVGLAIGYPGYPDLLSGLSMAVAPGERVALRAPSGTGKTTLARVLAGYIAPRRGRVLVDGSPLAGTRGPRAVQLLPQHPEQGFDPRLRLARSLAEGAAVDAAEHDALRERFGVREEWLARFPHELSGGELMRLCMVRALASRPRYLIADEATAMLDAVTQAELWRVLCDLQAERELGILFVSHSPALVARLATRCIDL